MLKEKDITILDDILDIVIKNNGSALYFSSFDELPYFLSLNSSNIYHEFERLARIISEFDAAQVFNLEKGSNARPVIRANYNSQNFKDNGGFSKLYQDELDRIDKAETIEKLKTKNLKLQNENLEYLQTIREQETRIRNLEEQNKFFELLKSYWWFIGLCIFAGGILKEPLEMLLTYMKQLIQSMQI